MKREMNGRGARGFSAGNGLLAAVASVCLPAVGMGAINYYDWKPVPNSTGLRTKANYVGFTTGSLTNEQTGFNVLRFDQSTILGPLLVDGSNDLQVSGVEFASTAQNFTLSGGRVLYSYANADGNNHILVSGGTQTVSGMRIRGSGNFTNNSSAAVGLTMGGANGLMTNPASSGTFTVTFDGTGRTSLNFMTRRNTSTQMHLSKVGTGTLAISGSFATEATSSVVGYTTGTTRVTGGTLEVGVLADGGVTSSIGASTSAASNLVISGGTFTYAGTTAATTNRLFNVGLNGAQINASGAAGAPVTYSATGPIEFNGETGARTLTLGGTNTDTNVLGLAIPDEGTNAVKLTKADVGKWRLTGSLTYSGPTEVTGGNLTIASPAHPISFAVSVANSGASINFDTPASPTNSVVVADIGVLALSSGGGASIVTTDRSVNQVRLATIDSLAASPTSLFNLNNNDLIIGDMTPAAVTALVASWWNGGLRNGPGIGTALSAGDVTTLAVVPNDNGGARYRDQFDGIDVALTDVLVKYTYLGDTNIDGKVDGNDLAALIKGLRSGLTGWTNGDTNYDGKVDGADYANLLVAMRQQGSVLEAEGPALGGAVPEPRAAGLLVAAVMLGGRRRR